MRKKLIAGLGNPEPGYNQTRHNVGFCLLDLLAKDLGVSLDRKKRQSLYGEKVLGDSRVFLVKPQTYMNNSGDSLVQWVGQEGLDPAADLLVVCDEMQLPPGSLRFRAAGSAGSHNGLVSIIQRLGTQQFARIRIGVGKPDSAAQWADFVLEKFPPDEKKVVDAVLSKALAGCRLWAEGAPSDKLMSSVNQKTGLAP